MSYDWKAEGLMPVTAADHPCISVSDKDIEVLHQEDVKADVLIIVVFQM